MGTAVVRDAWTLSQKRKGTQVLRQTQPETASEGCRMTRLASSRTAGKPAVRNEPRGWRNRGHDLMAICHDARKGRYSGSHWSKPARLRSTRPATRARFRQDSCRLSGVAAVLADRVKSLRCECATSSGATPQALRYGLGAVAWLKKGIAVHFARTC